MILKERGVMVSQTNEDDDEEVDGAAMIMNLIKSKEITKIFCHNNIHCLSQ